MSKINGFERKNIDYYISCITLKFISNNNDNSMPNTNKILV